MVTNIGAGVGGQVGWKDQSASNYGVYGAPVKFFEANKATVTKTKNVVVASGIAAGRLADYSSRRAITSVGATANIDLDVPFSGGYGELVKNLFGSTFGAPVQQSASIAYLQTHTLGVAGGWGDTKGIQGTLQVGIPSTDGTVNPYNYNGCKTLKGTWSCGVDGLLNSVFDMDCQHMEETDVIAAPSYPTANVFQFGQSLFKWGAFGAEAQLDGVKSVSVTVERKSNTARYYQGNVGTGNNAAIVKDEPITNDTMMITGTFDVDFVAKANFADKMAIIAAGLDTPQSMIWSFTGPIIASTFAYSFEIDLPAVFIDSPSPSLDSKDIVSTQFAFTAMYDGTHSPMTLKLMSTDTTL